MSKVAIKTSCESGQLTEIILKLYECHGIVASYPKVTHNSLLCSFPSLRVMYKYQVLPPPNIIFYHLSLSDLTMWTILFDSLKYTLEYLNIDMLYLSHSSYNSCKENSIPQESVAVNSNVKSQLVKNVKTGIHLKPCLEKVMHTQKFSHIWLLLLFYHNYSCSIMVPRI